MAIAVKSSTSATDNGGSATVSVTTAETSATSVGDLVVFFYGNDYYALSNMGTPSVTGSPTLTNFATMDAGTNHAHIKGYWYVANTAGAQTISATETGSHDEEKWLVAVVFSGADTTTPIDGTAGTGFNITSQPTWTAPATSPSATDSYLLAVLAAGGGASPASYTTPSPLTEVLEFHAGGASGVFATYQLSASGSTGTFAFTPVTSSEYGAMTVAIKTGSAAVASLPALVMAPRAQRYTY